MKRSICVLFLVTFFLPACQGLREANQASAEANTFDSAWTTLFDGQSLDGWTTPYPDWFRVEDGAIVAGSLEKPSPGTYFLAAPGNYYNFELTFEVKVLGPRESANGGVQFRSIRNDKGASAIGYQADIGQDAYWAVIYDEHRRNRVLTTRPEGFTVEDNINHGGWNQYRVIAKDNHLQMWVNGIQVADYVEEDPAIAAQTGQVMVQAHSGPAAEVWYRNLRIKELD